MALSRLVTLSISSLRNYVHSSIAIILMGKRELAALLNLFSWCLMRVERLFLAVPRGCLRFVIVVFPEHTHLLFLRLINSMIELIDFMMQDFLPDVTLNMIFCHI